MPKYIKSEITLERDRGSMKHCNRGNVPEHYSARCAGVFCFQTQPRACNSALILAT